MGWFKLLSKAPNYVRRFGLVDGLRTEWAVEGWRTRPQRSSRRRRVRLPGWPAPVWLRDCVGDHATFWQCLVQDQYDVDRFPQAAALQARHAAALAAGRAPLIVDAGANIGLATLWFARRFPGAHVVALEPDADNLALLRENVAPLGARVTVLEGGLWGAPGWLRVVDPSEGPASLRTEPAAPDGPGAVRAYTVDEIVALRGGDAPFVVKLDIEGAQAGVFAGDTGWLARCDLVTLELDDWQFPWQATGLPFLRSLAQHRYDVLIGGESLFCFRHTGDELPR